MEDIVDLIATDSAASDITDKIKELLYGKAGEKIEGLRPGVANSMFDQSPESEEDDEETAGEEGEL